MSENKVFSLGKFEFTHTYTQLTISETTKIRMHTQAECQLKRLSNVVEMCSYFAVVSY